MEHWNDVDNILLTSNLSELANTMPDIKNRDVRFLFTYIMRQYQKDPMTFDMNKIAAHIIEAFKHGKMPSDYIDNDKREAFRFTVRLHLNNNLWITRKTSHFVMTAFYTRSSTFELIRECKQGLHLTGDEVNESACNTYVTAILSLVGFVNHPRVINEKSQRVWLLQDKKLQYQDIKDRLNKELKKCKRD